MIFAVVFIHGCFFHSFRDYGYWQYDVVIIIVLAVFVASHCDRVADALGSLLTQGAAYLITKTKILMQLQAVPS